MQAISHTFYMTWRQLRNLARQPWYVAFTLVQPIVYLLLFGSLFQKVVQLPGFGSDSYITFLTPGVVIMTAMFSAGWNGMSMVDDLDRGILDRFLVSPVNRPAIIAGRLVQSSTVIVIQSVIIIFLGWLRGASFPGGIDGIILLIVCAILLAAPFAALSNGMALVMRKEESVIGAVNFILLPLTFLSPVFMARDLMPSWMQSVTSYNPVTWAITAGREVLKPDADLSLVWSRVGYLAVFAVISVVLATRAFRAYQRSI